MAKNDSAGPIFTDSDTKHMQKTPYIYKNIARFIKYLFFIPVFCDIISSMKMKKCVFSSLLILCGMTPALASDCTGAECDFNDIMYADTVVETVPAARVMPTPIARYEQPTEYIYTTPIPMRSVKTLSIKPVPEDTRPALWDGSHTKPTPHKYDKTVDPRNGVPVWDDSISNYKLKDFSDWYLEPMPEIYLREVDAPSYEYDSAVALYNQNMADAAATRARIDELLEPNRPQFNLWTDDCDAGYVPSPEYTAVDMTEIVSATFGPSDGCPFDSETECEIWRRKPIVRETVSPRSPTIRADLIAAFVDKVKCNPAIKATDPVAAPLLDRYKMLMRSANACCTDGLVYSLKRAGASDGLVYKFMSDDANFYGFGARCLMMTDDELDAKYPNTSTAAVTADVRNGCLCRARQWFAAMLAPFQQAYNAAPEFANQKFYYTYTDGLQRRTTVSINNDVQNVLKQLEACP